jgi:uncharacterized membrane protein YraQ (UPF0718 family)
MIMHKNVGTQEAHIRTGAAFVVLIIALLIPDQPVIRIVLAIIAAILAGTAFLRVCPLNTLIGRNTYDGTQAPPAADPTPEAPAAPTVGSDTEKPSA